MSDKSKNAQSGNSEAQVPRDHVDPRDESADAIIRDHVGFALGIGAIPVPIADIVAISAVELDMIRQLADLYNRRFDKDLGKSVVSAATTAAAGVGLGRSAASALKSFPVFGTVLGVGAQVVLAGASTYALGELFKDHFREGGRLETFDFELLRDKFRELFKEGRFMARRMRSEPEDERVMRTLEKLSDLKEKGSITAAEYERSKERLLSKLGK
jgi:uncharacterized protein (DUF697 family)